MTDSEQYFESDSFKQMLEAYEESKKSGNPVFLDSDEYADIAEYYDYNGKSDLAIEVADEAISIYPGAIGPLAFKARYVLQNEQNTEKADAICEQIIDKSDLDYYYIKAEILIVDNKAEEAHQYLLSRLSHIDDEDYEDYILDVTTLFLDYEWEAYAEKWLHMAKGKQTNEHLELLGRIYIFQGKYGEAERLFNQLLDQSPFTLEYWIYLINCQRLSNKFEDAITSCEYAWAINPKNSDVIINFGSTYLQKGDAKMALPYFELYVSQHPNDETGETYYGLAMSKLDRNDEAENHLKKAESLANASSPNMPIICQELAFVMSKKGNVEESFSYIEKCVGFGLPATIGDFLKGYVMLENSSEEDARYWFRKARRNASDIQELFLKICTAYYDNGYYDSAYRMFKNLSKECLNAHPEIYAYMADCCRHLNRRRPYLFNLERACRLAADETKNVLGNYYPAEMNPANYFNFENLWNTF